MTQQEQTTGRMNQKLNVLRAGVLGANDGIMSTAGLVLGVAGATTDIRTLAITGLSGIIAGAFSMGGGEYVSVSTQKDTEKAVVQAEERSLRNDYDGERLELANIYRGNGLSEQLSLRVADELMERDAVRAHAMAEHGVNPDDLINPWHAAFSSMLSFAIGAVLPVLAILLTPPALRVYCTGIGVFLALAATGFISAALGEAPKVPAILRNVVVGTLIMAVTYTVGRLI